MKQLLYLVPLVAGALLPLQAIANDGMRRAGGTPEWAALVSFSVGTVSLAVFYALQRHGLPPWSALAAAPWWAWVGGCLGAVYVGSVAFLVPRLGVATTTTLLIAGSVFAALALETVGAGGTPARPLSIGRVLGAVLLVAGVLLVKR